MVHTAIPITSSLVNRRVPAHRCRRRCLECDDNVVYVDLGQHHDGVPLSPSVKLRHHPCFPVATTDLRTALYICHWCWWWCFDWYKGAENDVDSLVLYQTNCISQCSAPLPCHCSQTGYVPGKTTFLTVTYSLPILLFSSLFELSHLELCLLPKSCRCLSRSFVIPQSQEVTCSQTASPTELNPHTMGL